jgi:hypothetical protein
MAHFPSTKSTTAPEIEVQTLWRDHGSDNISLEGVSNSVTGQWSDNRGYVQEPKSSYCLLIVRM